MAVDALLAQPALTPRLRARARRTNAAQCAADPFAACAAAHGDTSVDDAADAAAALDALERAGGVARAAAGLDLSFDVIADATWLHGPGRARPPRLDGVSPADTSALVAAARQRWPIGPAVLAREVRRYQRCCCGSSSSRAHGKSSSAPSSSSPAQPRLDVAAFVVWFTRERESFLWCVAALLRLHQRFDALCDLWDLCENGHGSADAGADAEDDENGVDVACYKGYGALDDEGRAQWERTLARVAEGCRHVKGALHDALQRCLPADAVAELVPLLRSHGAAFPREPSALVHAARERALLAETLFLLAGAAPARAGPRLPGLPALLRLLCDGPAVRTPAGDPPSLALVRARDLPHYTRAMHAADLLLALAPANYLWFRFDPDTVASVRDLFPSLSSSPVVDGAAHAAAAAAAAGNESDGDASSSGTTTATTLGQAESVPVGVLPFVLAWALRVAGARDAGLRGTLPFCAAALAAQPVHTMLLRAAEAAYGPLGAWPLEVRRAVFALVVREATADPRVFSVRALPDFDALVRLLADATSGCPELASRLILTTSTSSQSEATQTTRGLLAFLRSGLDASPDVFAFLRLCAAACVDGEGAEFCSSLLAAAELRTFCVPAAALDRAVEYRSSTRCVFRADFELPGLFLPAPTTDAPVRCLITSGTTAQILDSPSGGSGGDESNNGSSSNSSNSGGHDSDNKRDSRRMVSVRLDAPADGRTYTVWECVLGYVAMVSARAQQDGAWRLDAVQRARLGAVLAFLGAFLGARASAALAQALAARLGAGDARALHLWLLEHALVLTGHLWAADYGPVAASLRASAADLLAGLCAAAPAAVAAARNKLAAALLCRDVCASIAASLAHPGPSAAAQHAVLAASRTLPLYVHAADLLARDSLVLVDGGTGMSGLSGTSSGATAFSESVYVQLVAAVRDSFFLALQPCGASAVGASETWALLGACAAFFERALQHAQHTLGAAAARAVNALLSEAACVARLHLVLVYGAQHHRALAALPHVAAAVTAALRLAAASLRAAAPAPTPLALSLLAPTVLSLADFQLSEPDVPALVGVNQPSNSGDDKDDDEKENNEDNDDDTEKLFGRAMVGNLVVLARSVVPADVQEALWALLGWCCALDPRRIAAAGLAPLTLAGYLGARVSVLRTCLQRVLMRASRDPTEALPVVLRALDFVHSAVVHQPALVYTLLAQSGEGANATATTTKTCAQTLVELLCACSRADGDAFTHAHLALADRVLGVLLAMRERKGTLGVAATALERCPTVWPAAAALVLHTSTPAPSALALCCQADALLLIASELAQYGRGTAPAPELAECLQSLLSKDSAFPDVSAAFFQTQIDLQQKGESGDDMEEEEDDSSNDDENDEEDDSVRYDPGVYVRVCECARRVALGRAAAGGARRPAWAWCRSANAFVLDAAFLGAALVPARGTCAERDAAALTALARAFNRSSLFLAATHALARALAVFFAGLARFPLAAPRRAAVQAHCAPALCDFAALVAQLVGLSGEDDSDCGVLPALLTRPLAGVLCQLACLCAPALDSPVRAAVTAPTAHSLVAVLSRPLAVRLAPHSEARFYHDLLVGCSGDDSSNSTDNNNSNSASGADEEVSGVLCCLEAALVELVRTGADAADVAETLLPLVSFVTRARLTPAAWARAEPALFARAARLYDLAAALVGAVLEHSPAPVADAALAAHAEALLTGATHAFLAAHAFDAPPPLPLKRRRALARTAAAAARLLVVCVRALPPAAAPRVAPLVRALGAPPAPTGPAATHLVALLACCTDRLGEDATLLNAVLDVVDANRASLARALDISSVFSTSTASAPASSASALNLMAAAQQQPQTREEQRKMERHRHAFLERVKWTVALLLALCRRFDAWARVPGRTTLAQAVLGALTRFVWQVVVLARAPAWTTLAPAPQQALVRALLTALVALRVALPAFARTRTLRFRTEFLQGPLYAQLYRPLVRPLATAAEPSLGTFLDCVALLEQGSDAPASAPAPATAAGLPASLREPVQQECLAVLLALVSMYWEDRHIPSSDRRNLRDQILPRLEGLVAQPQQTLRPDHSPEFLDFVTHIRHGVALLFGKPHRST